MSEDSDVYRELGYLPRQDLKDGEIGEVRKNLSRKNNFDALRGTDKRDLNFKILRELIPDLLDEGQSMVVVDILDRRIEFHPSSDTWYSHARREYGYGIENQVKKMKSFLERKNEPR